MHLLMLKYPRFLYANKRDYLCTNDSVILGASHHLRIYELRRNLGVLSHGCDVMNAKSAIFHSVI
jgi:hypothetical protein